MTPHVSCCVTTEAKKKNCENGGTQYVNKTIRIKKIAHNVMEKLFNFLCCQILNSFFLLWTKDRLSWHKLCRHNKSNSWLLRLFYTIFKRAEINYRRKYIINENVGDLSWFQHILVALCLTSEIMTMYKTGKVPWLAYRSWRLFLVLFSSVVGFFI